MLPAITPETAPSVISEVSLTTPRVARCRRVEITNGYAKANARASKAEQGGVLDELALITGSHATTPAVGWSPQRDGPQVWAAGRPASEEAGVGEVLLRGIKVLQRVWAASGGQRYTGNSVSLVDLLTGREQGRSIKTPFK